MLSCRCPQNPEKQGTRGEKILGLQWARWKSSLRREVCMCEARPAPPELCRIRISRKSNHHLRDTQNTNSLFSVFLSLFFHCLLYFHLISSPSFLEHSVSLTFTLGGRKLKREKPFPFIKVAY